MNDAKEIVDIFNTWIQRVCAMDVNGVVDLYDSEETCFFGTFSADLRTDKNRVKDYFESLFSSANRVEVSAANPRVRVLHAGAIALNAGYYTFSIEDKSGLIRTVKARYTFIYQKTCEQWLIVEHHSSVLPA